MLTTPTAWPERRKRNFAIPASQQGWCMVMSEDSVYPELKDRFLRMRIVADVKDEWSPRKVRGASERLRRTPRAPPTAPLETTKKHVFSASNHLYDTQPVTYIPRSAVVNPFTWSSELRSTFAEPSPCRRQTTPTRFIRRYYERPLEMQKITAGKLAATYAPRSRRVAHSAATQEEVVHRLAVADVKRRKDVEAVVLRKFEN